MVKVGFAALIFLVLIVCTHGIELSDIKKFFTSLLKTRQCRAHEMFECMTATWTESNCNFEDGKIRVTREEDSAVLAAACSMNLLRDFYTPRKAINDMYIKVDDIGYTKTASLSLFYIRDQNESKKLCFVQETVKCFEKKNCDIHDHSNKLRNAYDTCQKTAPVILNTAALLVKEAWAELKNLF